MANAREIIFSVDPDLSTWTPDYTGVGGSITTSGTNNTVATITNPASGRTFLRKSFSFAAGVWYFFSAKPDIIPVGFDSDAGLGVSLSVDDGDQVATMLNGQIGSRVGVLFKFNTPKSAQLRIGIGITGAKSAGTIQVSDIQFQRYGTTEPEFVDKYYDVSGHSEFPFNFFTKKAAACVYSGGGVIAQTDPTDIDTHPYSIGLCIGDSYGTGGTITAPTGRYPYELKYALNRRQSTDKRTFIYNYHIGGENLIQILARIPDACQGAVFPASCAELLSVPDYVVIGTGGNSVVDDFNFTQCLEQLDDCIDELFLQGVSRIYIVGMPPWEGYGSYSSGRNSELIAYNEAIGDYYRGCHVCHPRDFLQGDANENRLSSVGDGDTWDFNSTEFGVGGGDYLHPGFGKYSASEYLGRAIAQMIINTSGQTAAAESFASVSIGTIESYFLFGGARLSLEVSDNISSLISPVTTLFSGGGVKFEMDAGQDFSVIFDCSAVILESSDVGVTLNDYFPNISLNLITLEV